MVDRIAENSELPRYEPSLVYRLGWLSPEELCLVANVASHLETGTQSALLKDDWQKLVDACKTEFRSRGLADPINGVVSKFGLHDIPIEARIEVRNGEKNRARNTSPNPDQALH